MCSVLVLLSAHIDMFSGLPYAECFSPFSPPVVTWFTLWKDPIQVCLPKVAPVILGWGLRMNGQTDKAMEKLVSAIGLYWGKYKNQHQYNIFVLRVFLEMDRAPHHVGVHKFYTHNWLASFMTKNNAKQSILRCAKRIHSICTKYLAPMQRDKFNTYVYTI